MANYRKNKVNSAVEAEMAAILREIKDPRVADAFVTITAARVSADLKYCKLYYSALGGDKAQIAKGLSSASGFIRSRLAERLNLRVTPELSFEADNSIEHGARIAEVLKRIDAERSSRGTQDQIPDSDSTDSADDADNADDDVNDGANGGTEDEE